MEEISYLRVIAAFLFVIALIAVFSLALRRWQGSRLSMGLKQPRQLYLREQLYIDQKHKLLLIEWQESQHLVLLGAQQPLLLASKATDKADITSQKAESS